MITTAEEARNIYFNRIKELYSTTIENTCQLIREAAANLQPEIDVRIEGSNDERWMVGKYLVYLGYEVWEQRDVLTIIWQKNNKEWVKTKH